LTGGESAVLLDGVFEFDGRYLKSLVGGEKDIKTGRGKTTWGGGKEVGKGSLIYII